MQNYAKTPSLRKYREQSAQHLVAKHEFLILSAEFLDMKNGRLQRHRACNKTLSARLTAISFLQDLLVTRPTQQPWQPEKHRHQATASDSTRSSGSSQVNVDKSRSKRNCNELYMSKPSLTELYIKKIAQTHEADRKPLAVHTTCNVGIQCIGPRSTHAMSCVFDVDLQVSIKYL